MKALLKRSVALLVVPLIAACSGCSTTERPQQSHDHHHAPPTDQGKASASNKTVPDKSADIFREIETHFQQLAAAIQQKNARQAHQHDDAIRALVGRIPERATAETKAKVAELAGSVSNAARGAHRSAHEDQWIEASGHVKQGQAYLAVLRATFKEALH